MKLINQLYTEWNNVNTAPFEEKNLKKFLESGKAAIIANVGMTTYICGISEDAVNTGKILFINPRQWAPKLLADEIHLDILKAIGYLIQKDEEDASSLLYTACVEKSIALVDEIWEKQCLFNENYSGYRTIDREAKIALQDVFPDILSLDKLYKYMLNNEKELKADIKSFKEKSANNIAEFRKTILSSHLKSLSDKEYLEHFTHDEKELRTLYQNLKIHLKEMKETPLLFNCTNYLLRGGEYHDIPGFCKLVPISEIEENNWSLKPENYV